MPRHLHTASHIPDKRFRQVLQFRQADSPWRFVYAPGLPFLTQQTYVFINWFTSGALHPFFCRPKQVLEFGQLLKMFKTDGKISAAGIKKGAGLDRSISQESICSKKYANEKTKKMYMEGLKKLDITGQPAVLGNRDGMQAPFVLNH